MNPGGRSPCQFEHASARHGQASQQSHSVFMPGLSKERGEARPLSNDPQLIHSPGANLAAVNFLQPEHVSLERRNIARELPCRLFTCPVHTNDCRGAISRNRRPVLDIKSGEPNHASGSKRNDTEFMQ